MSKYYFENDLSLNSSTGMILNKIQNGSAVLEFGCATGRMTRYMKEELDCQVYIVEYEKEAYQMALAYAEDGLCDDIMQFQWVEKFQNAAFDAIIFADVLEHLTEPERVLCEAGKLLKENGRIYVSVPNITHNDILLKLYDDRFDYTPTGILDNTHVHFWGLENIKQLSGNTGLYIESLEATRCPAGATEQYPDACEPRMSNQPDLFSSLLRERSCGEVYQFIVTFSKEKPDTIRYQLPEPSIKSHVYFDTGRDFNAEEVREVEAVYGKNGTYRLHCVIEQTDTLKRIKFDPVEYQSCILHHISIRQDNQELSLQYADGMWLQEGLLLGGTDPMVYADIILPGEAVVIEAEIVLAGEFYLELLQSNNCSQYEQIECLYEAKAALEEQIRHQEWSRQQEVAFLQERHSGEQAALQKEITRLHGEIADLSRDINSFMILLNNKEQYIIELEKQAERSVKLPDIKSKLSLARIRQGLKRRVKRFLKR